MPWPQKKPMFPGVMSALGGGMPGVAPTGLAQPNQALPSMAKDLKPAQVPQSIPKTPKLSPQPSFADNELKKRALANIAMGRKGF